MNLNQGPYSRRKNKRAQEAFCSSSSELQGPPPLNLRLDIDDNDDNGFLRTCDPPLFLRVN